METPTMLDCAEPDRSVDAPSLEAPTTLALRHRLFALVPGAVFHLAPDGVPVMSLPLGERNALVPVESLIREIGIRGEDPDGRLLKLLPEALTFVTGLRLGDPLPPEIVSGDANWSAAPGHLTTALCRVRVGLLRWHGSQGHIPAALIRAAAEGEDSTAIQDATSAAFNAAAAALRMTSAGAVIAEAEEFAREVAYIESLRHSLLRPVKQMTEQVRGLGTGGRVDLQRAETLTAVTRLMDRARVDLAQRFGEADALIEDDFLATMRDADLRADTLRASRDWLYRTGRAWQPVLHAWARSDGPTRWDRLDDTYRFLAPRYMPVAEWTRRMRDMQARSSDPDRDCVVW